MKHCIRRFAVTVAVVVGSSVAAADFPIEDLKGFSGQVRGVVVKKGEKNTVDFKVARVIQVWRNNEAKNPDALAGRTVPVGPRWQKTGGKWNPVELHVAFLKTLKPGEEITLELKHAEREHFAILELSHEQRARAGLPKEKRGEKEARKGDGAEAEIRELRAQLERLKRENAELRERLAR